MRDIEIGILKYTVKSISPLLQLLLFCSAVCKFINQKKAEAVTMKSMISIYLSIDKSTEIIAQA